MKKLKVLSFLTAVSFTLLGCGTTIEKYSSNSSNDSTQTEESTSVSQSSVSDSESSSNVSSSSQSSSADSGEGKRVKIYNGNLRIHYHRDDETYTNMSIYLWNSTVAGQEYDWTGIDEFGVFLEINLGESKQFGKHPSNDIRVIAKYKKTWNGKTEDTFCAFSEFFVTEEGGVEWMNIYLVAEGNALATYNTANAALGDRIAGAYAQADWKSILIRGTGTQGSRAPEEVGLIYSYKIYALDVSYYSLPLVDREAALDNYLLAEKTLDSSEYTSSLTVTLADEIVPNIVYEVHARFVFDTSKEKIKTVSMNNLYDTQKFIDEYTYNGHDLGVNADENGNLVFKLWAPTAARASVLIFASIVPWTIQGITASSEPYTYYDMTLEEKGVWVYRSNKPKNSTFSYNFSLTNSNGFIQVVDPYAKASAINSTRSCYLNFDDANNAPENWNEGTGVDNHLPAIASANQLSVYEAHIRDLTADETWVSNEGNLRGTYNAFVEEGTTYSENGVTVSTGFDHIKELGINAIQLLPVFDQDNEERWTDSNGEYITDAKKMDSTSTAPAYNWGYNPQNYNCVEGAYCSDPFNPATRVKEYKNLILKSAENGIRIIMDVVYNHMSSVTNNSFNKIIPGYYFRTDANGNYTNGSGVGNEIASERPMARNFIVDSCRWWAEEYRIKGFRFDLMGCLDLTTMKAIRTALDEIDPTIVLYGEGWTGGGSALPDSQRATTGNVYNNLNVNDAFPIGCFNDAGRDGTKGNTVYGNVTPDTTSGFINASSPSTDQIYNCLTQVIGENRWYKPTSGCNPNQTVNYVACHDNYTLYDQCNYMLHGASGCATDHDDAVKMALSCQGISMFGEGIGFLQGGDEIFRQKLIKSDDPHFSEMVESYIGKSAGHDWIEGDGIEIDRDTWLVRNSYKYGDDVNAFQWDRKVKFKDECARFAALIKLRNAEMGNSLGMNAALVKASEAYCWSSTDLPAGSTVIAGGMNGQKDGNPVYVFLGNRYSSGTIGIGNGTVKVLFDSTGARKVGSTITISNYKMPVNKLQCLIVRRVS